MATTLSNGYKKPETGDLGDVWFPALEDNIQRVNDHSHDGSNSEKLDATAVDAIQTTIASGDFVLDSGVYKTTLVLPLSTEVDKKIIQFRDAITREPVYLKFEYVLATQIEVFTNIPLDLIVVVL